MATLDEINRAYATALGRSSDSGGTDYYAKSGMSYEQILNSMYGSQEYATTNPNASSGVGFNSSGVRADQGQQALLNETAYDYSKITGKSTSAQQLNAIINPFTYDALTYDKNGSVTLSQPANKWNGSSNVPVTLAPEGARNLYDATMVSGMPTAYVDAMGGYNAMYDAAQRSPNFQSGAPSLENIARFGSKQWADTIGLTGNKPYMEGGQYYKEAQKGLLGGASASDKINYQTGGIATGSASPLSVVNGSSLSSIPSGSNTGFTTNEIKTAAISDSSNPLVQQAIARSRQSFAGRGLLNSSMAEEAAQEAAISKALDIAQPDTSAYYADSRDAKQFDYSKALAELGYGQTEKMARLNNDLSLSNAQAQYNMKVGDTTHTNYLTMIDRVQSDATKQVQQINSSSMPYDEKVKAINSIQAQSQASIANSNELFKTMNGWQSEWAVAANSYGWNVAAAPVAA
jgi:hypothetical protein